MKTEDEVKEMKKRVIAKQSLYLNKGDDRKHRDMTVALRYLKLVLEDLKK